MNEIRKWQKISQNHKHKAFITVMVDKILRNTNKMLEKNSIKIYGESDNILDINLTMEKTNIISKEICSQTSKERYAVVVKCLYWDDEARKAAPQLTFYMRILKCKTGLLITPNIALIYEDNETETELANQIGPELNLNKDDNVISLIEYINSVP